MIREVFICHSFEDQSIADAVCAALEADNIRCWLAPRDVPSARRVPGEITRAIRQSKVLVLILSRHANECAEVLRKVQLAFDQNLPVIQFRIEDVALTDDLAYLLSGQHKIDAITRSFSNHLGKLLTAIKEMLKPAAEETATDSADNPPLSTKLPSQDGAGLWSMTSSRFWKLVTIVAVSAAAVFVLRKVLNVCLDTPLSKLIPDALTTALVLMSLAVAAAPYLAGQDLGPLKVPEVSPKFGHALKIAGPLLVIAVVVVLFVPLKFVLRQDCFTLRNGSAEEADTPIGWNAAYWPGARRPGRLEVATDQAHTGLRSFKISADEPNHLRFVQALKLEPRAKYLLTGWGRTENVAHSQNEPYDRGANLAIQFTSPQQVPVHSAPVFGTNDWQQLSLEFETHDLVDVEVQLQLGGYSATTTGTVWFDDVQLKRLSW